MDDGPAAALLLNMTRSPATVTLVGGISRLAGLEGEMDDHLGYGSMIQPAVMAGIRGMGRVLRRW
jgi:hypothetical protein